MEISELNRAFGAFAPSKEQRAEMLERILNGQPKKGTVRRIKKPAAILIAAAVMLATCAFAVASGVSPALLRYLGMEPEEAPLLSPMAIPMDLAVTDNGCTLEVKQVLADRYSVLILTEFTAPEGTVLDGEVYSLASGRDGLQTAFPQFSDFHAGSCSWGFGWTLLEDEDPADNRISLLYTLEAMSGTPELLGSTVSFTLDQLREGTPEVSQTVFRGNWSFRITLPAEDSGRTYSLREPVAVDGRELLCTSVYLSPLSLVVEFDEDEAQAADLFHRLSQDGTKRISLHTRDGETIGLGTIRWMNTYTDQPGQPHQLEGGRFSFQPERILDPSEIASVTLLGTTLSLSA